jgi:hypothetical protein
MSLRAFLLNNLRWKLTALLLAMLVWFVIKFAIYRGVGGHSQMLRRQPVMVLKAPEDPRVFRIDPPQVDVVVQSSGGMDRDDVQVFVNLTTMPDVGSVVKQVLVRAADSAKLRVEPPFVVVEHVVPTDSGLNDSFRKP